MKIAIETKRPANVVGLHIDPRGDVVEIIRNMATNHDAVQIIKDFALSLDKKVMELLNRLYENSGDYKYKPCPLFERYVRSKWLGCKTGRGFHKYDDN